MPTQDTVISISLAKGVDTKTDLKQGVNGRLLTLENAVFTGVTDIEKRNGYAPKVTNVISSATPITTGNSVGTFNDSLVIDDNKSLYSYSETEAGWVNNGLAVATQVSTQSLSGAINSKFWPAIAHSDVDNVKAVVTPLLISSATTNGFIYSTFDTINEVLLYTATVSLAYTPLAVKILQVSSGGTGKFVIIITHSTGTDIYSAPSTPPTSTAPTLVTSLSGSAVPADMTASSSSLYILTYDSTNIVLNQYSVTTLTLTNTTNVVPGSTPQRIGIVYDGINGELLVGYTIATQAIISRYNASTLAFISTPVSHTDSQIGTGANISFATDGTNMAYFYDNVPITGNGYISCQEVDAYRTTPVPGTIIILGLEYCLYSKAFASNGMFYTAIIYQGVNIVSGNLTISNPPDSQTGIIVLGINATTYTAAAKISYDHTYLYNNPAVPVTNPNIIGLTQWSHNGMPILSAISNTISSAGGSLRIVNVYSASEATLTFSNKLRNLNLGANLNISGGEGLLFDGEGVAEQGFNNYPEIITLTGPTTPMPTISYEYVAVYVWYDAQGNLHRSAPSIPRQIILVSAIDNSNNVTLTVSGLGISEPYKMPNVQVQIYRTQANADIFYLIATLPNNDVNPIQFIDNIGDVLIPGSIQLYTTGQEVDNITPPAHSLMTEFKNRQIIVNDEDRLQWWFSKQVIEGFPVEFSDVFVQNIDQKGGPISALSTMDDKLIFFKSSNVWYVFGDGPASNGTNNDFTYPQLISSDTGCNNQDSIILTPTGLLFQSPKGIYQLSRNLELSYIGAPVEAYNNINVTSVQMIAGTTQVRFTLASGVCLVYDYLVGQWSVFDNIAAVDSVIYKGNFTYLDSSGVIHTETPGVYFDDTASIPLNFRTGWIKLSDIQGFERFKKMLLIGSANGSSNLQVNFYFDYNATTAYPVSSIPVNFILEQQRVQYRLFPSRQKCEAFQIEVIETPNANSPGIYSISNLALEVGMKKGPYKLPAAQSYG